MEVRARGRVGGAVKRPSFRVIDVTRGIVSRKCNLIATASSLVTGDSFDADGGRSEPPSASDKRLEAFNLPIQ